MAKKKPNEIREEMRKQMAAKYKEQVEELRKRSSDNWKLYADTLAKLQRSEEEKSKLKELVEQQKDWIERLMEFIDMPEEERHNAVQKYIKERKMSEDFRALFSPYFKTLHRLNLLSL